jgi:hypothetical protein
MPALSHGQTGSRTYRIWTHIKTRCSNPKYNRYNRYAGRGIAVCDRWRESFEAFLADMGEAPDSMSIERIDNDGNYEPGNCRWATIREQTRNRCSNIWVEYRGRRLVLKDYAEAVGVGYKSLHRIVKYRGEDPLSAAVRLQGYHA